jgi:hypothetical protein
MAARVGHVAGPGLSPVHTPAMRPVLENRTLRSTVIRDAAPASAHLQPLIFVPKPSAPAPAVVQKPKLASLNPVPESSELPPIGTPIDPAAAPPVARLPIARSLVVPIRPTVLATRTLPRLLEGIQPIPPPGEESPDEAPRPVSGRLAPLSIIEHARRNVKSRIRS